MPTVNQIRAQFLDYFKRNGHEVVSSSPLVPHNDPTLMFTNAGMVQFKDVFTQSETRLYKRATSSQKCVRAGGKHNDLDNVGYTARHHTFFEMLGNFSFGDYFKDDAIKFAWEFLTKEIGLPQDKLLVTVYHTDDEAFKLWKKISGLKDERIIRIATNDNFWAMGDTGPCGPCSEIFYDHGADIVGGPPGSADEDGDRFIEIWNLVFMQYEKLVSGDQVDLPAPSIDTGMGLERMAAILQGKHNNYDIDLFESLVAASMDVSQNKDEDKMVSHRVIADHLRSVSFLLADGVMPSNDGRGYVLRRIMRRAMRHARNLGCKDPVIYKLIPKLVGEMGEAYPELIRAQSLITEIIKLEEERFGETLDRGLKLLDDESASLKANDKLSGEVAFKLYDTYGFPYDLTVDILRLRNIGVDEDGFNVAMQQQKERARAAWKGSGEQATNEVWFKIHEKFGATEFLGYELEEAQANVLSIVVDGKIVSGAGDGDKVSVVLNQTPFYGESGGQEGDKGVIRLSDGVEVIVEDTLKVLGSLHVHVGKLKGGEIREGDSVLVRVDCKRRDALRANHSATHILHAVLRDVLGDHVTQKGSLVAEDKLRFDIAHPKAISSEELKCVENKVNEIIRQNSEVSTRIMVPEDAIKAGAMALFGEKYGDEVRVVNMGSDYSVELCGGTHVRRTGDIGVVKLVSESAIASGVRRIEALTGYCAMQYINAQEEVITNISAALKTSDDQVLERVTALVVERKQMEKELAKLRKDVAMGDDVEAEDINGVSFIGQNFGNVAPKDLRDLAGDVQKQTGVAVMVAGSSYEGKASLIVMVDKQYVEKFDAVKLAKSSVDILGARGCGGKPNFAQTGGVNGDKVDDAILQVKQCLVGS